MITKAFIRETVRKVLNEGLEQDYYVAKTTDSEVKDLLLRGHYLGQWPFAGSQYKDYIYGIYQKKTAKQTQISYNDEKLNEPIKQDTLVGCVVYGFAEPHASSYVSKWIRNLLDPNQTLESIYTTIKNLIQKDNEEEIKAKTKGYPFKPKAKTTIQNILNTTNLQDNQILELKRLFILPQHDAKNIESFSIKRGNDAVLQQNPNIQVIVSFSDSKVGHYGGIYQATNAGFAGLNKKGLFRYIYMREGLANTIKKYQAQFNQLVYQYPKQKDLKAIDGEKDTNLLSKREKITLMQLNRMLKYAMDSETENALKKVIGMISQPKQMKFSLKENTIEIYEKIRTKTID
jgi:hypothetical protein